MKITSTPPTPICKKHPTTDVPSQELVNNSITVDISSGAQKLSNLESLKKSIEGGEYNIDFDKLTAILVKKELL